MNNENEKYDFERLGYEKNTNVYPTKGINTALLNKIAGDSYTSLINKLHIINVVGIGPEDSTYKNSKLTEPKSFTDLCRLDDGSVRYDVEDFLYCKNLGVPINHLITLRRFPFATTDNIFDKNNQQEPDIARMVTYFNQDVNKLEDILSFSYGLRWKELTAEMESASIIGDSSGFSGFMKKVMPFVDPTMGQNSMAGENRLNYDPKHDQNKTYGPVDSLNQTHIRDAGFDFTKEFDLVFEYELRSIGGRTPEYAMKDLIANILACTYNNGKFWPGSRYWIGERPSKMLEHFRFLSPDSIDQFLQGGYDTFKNAIKQFSSPKSALETLKNVLINGLNFGFGKLLDAVGRPSVVVMNSLLSGEPVGNWHLTIGNPTNPIMCIGNLMCMGVDVKFPTDNLSYGDFPTKLQVNVRLKPAMPKDRAGIEMMFNHGKRRLYYTPKKVVTTSNSKNVSRRTKSYNGYDSPNLDRFIDDVFDFVDPTNKIGIVVSDTANNAESNLKTNISELKEKSKKGLKITQSIIESDDSFGELKKIMF